MDLKQREKFTGTAGKEENEITTKFKKEQTMILQQEEGGFFTSKKVWLGLLLLTVAILFTLGELSLAADGAMIPGKDESAKLEAAGTLLRIIDTGLFKWGARLFAGICIMSGAWALKEQRFGVAIICVIGAVVFGTCPIWVKNVFSMGGDAGVFGAVKQEVFEISASNDITRGGLKWSATTA